MADDKQLKIPIDSIIADFQDFITPDSNKRIIFSGPFGIGKTYFLNKFFGGKSEDYLPIFLRPVNYSLLSNEDVFKLIKYDILYQLIQFKEFKIDEAFTISKGDFTKFFVAKNGFAILSNLLKLIPKIQTTVEAVEKLGELIQAYKNGLDEVTQNPELKLMFDFQLETQENFLLEYDQVSQLISEQLTEIARNKAGEPKPLKKVLVIDDLDRLDPEHIFRLFNVFSAHFDQVHYYSDEGDKPADNKFGFDKIIFVCDIENIRKIFAHKYGAEVDFSGYIDKFYSSQVYHFNKNKTVQKYLKNIFKQYENDHPQKGGSQSSIISVVKIIVSDLIEAGAINHRVLENIQKDKIKFRKPYTLHFWSPYHVRNYQFVFIQVIDFLYDIFGKNYNSLCSAIEKAEDLKRNNAGKLINNHFLHLLPLLSLKGLDENAQYSWNHEQLNRSISFKIKQDSYDCYLAEITTADTLWTRPHNYYGTFLIALNNLKSIGIFDIDLSED